MLSAQAKEMVADVIASSAPKKQCSKWHAFFASWLGEAFDAMDASLYFIALVPAMSELLRTKSDTEIGQVGAWVLAVFMLGWFFGAIVFGMVADRWGRRRTMIATILLYSVATGFCAFTQNWVELAICRFFVGLGIGGEICLGTLLIAEFWKGKGRLWAASSLESSFNAGLIMAAGFNLVLGEHGWRWLFLAGVIPALLTLYIRSKLSESESFEQVKAHRESLKVRKHALDSEEAKLLQSTFSQLWNTGMRSDLIVVAMLGATAVIGYWACVAWIPAWINQLTGALAVSERSMATTIFSIGGLLGCVITPAACAKMGRGNALKLSYAGALISAVVMFVTVKEYGFSLMAWSLVLGVFTSFQFAALQVYIPEVFPTSVLGTATGIIFGVGRIFSAVLAICGGQLIAFYGGSYGLASATLSLIYVVGVVAAFKVRETDGQVAGLSNLTPLQERSQHEHELHGGMPAMSANA